MWKVFLSHLVNIQYYLQFVTLIKQLINRFCVEFSMFCGEKAFVEFLNLVLMKKRFPMKRFLAAIKKDNMAGLGITDQQRTFFPILFLLICDLVLP